MKRKSTNGGSSKKKYKVSSGIVEPGQYGIYATCNRNREQNCAKELKILFDEKVKEMYPVAEDESEGEELTVEQQIQREVGQLKNTKEAGSISSIPLGADCFVFLKTKKPVVPSEFVTNFIQNLNPKRKNTRFTQKLTPIDSSCSASMEEIKKLAQRVLLPHFGNNEKALKFAININRRNFATIDKMDIIKCVAAEVGEPHSVDLKKPDKLILIECFKNNVGMSVVGGAIYEQFFKFNLQQIFEKSENDGEKGDEKIGDERDEKKDEKKD